MKRIAKKIKRRCGCTSERTNDATKLMYRMAEGKEQVVVWEGGRRDKTDLRRGRIGASFPLSLIPKVETFKRQSQKAS